MKGRLTGKLVYHSVALLLCAVMLIVVPVSFGWFTSFWESGPDRINVKTGAVEYPPVLMWTYLMAEEATGGATAGWTPTTLTEGDEDGQKVAPAIELTEAGEEFTYSLPSLQIGTVDNVLTVKDDNIIYFRFEVDRADFGDTVTLGLGPAEATHTVDGTDYAFELYSGQGLDDGHVKTVAATAYTTLQAVLDGTIDPNDPTPKSIFSYGSCISSTALSPSDSAFDDLEFSEGQTTVTNTNTTAGKYYLYLRIMPNLPAFLVIAKSLATYMPCLILCDEQISISFSNYHTGN